MSRKQTKIYRSFSSKETKALGNEFARALLARRSRAGRGGAHPKSAAVFALQGDLGAGKTTFVQGFFEGLGLKKRAPSPTFVIMRRYALHAGKGRAKGISRVGRKPFSSVFHVDAYRLKNAAALGALGALGFEDILADPKNIVLIEWAERAKKILPKGATWLKFKHGRKENERTFVIIKQ